MYNNFNYNPCSDCIYSVDNNWCEKIGAYREDYLCDEFDELNNLSKYDEHTILSTPKKSSRSNKHKINKCFKEKYKKKCLYQYGNYCYFNGEYKKGYKKVKYYKKFAQKKVRHYDISTHKGNDYKKIDFIGQVEPKVWKTISKDKKENKKIISADDFIKFFYIEDEMVCDFIRLIEKYGFLKNIDLENTSYEYVPKMISKDIEIGIDIFGMDSYRIGIDPKNWFCKTSLCGICAYFPMSKRDYNNFINVIKKVLDDEHFKKHWDRCGEKLFKNK